MELLGHLTEDIDFNAADTQMKARLEGLPNVGVVDVERSAPSPEKGYSWTVTFTSNPGAFPVGSGDVPLLVSSSQKFPHGLAKLSGVAASTNITASLKRHRAGGLC